jgi:peptidoglycan/LPS O-acetylase OafA/YrhL
LFLMLLNKNRTVFITATLLLFVLAQYFHLKYYAQRWSLPDSIVDTVFFNPVVHISQFLVGKIGGYLFINKRTIMPKSSWVTLALFSLVILLIAARPDNISYQVGLIAPVFMLFIFSVAVSQTTFLNAKAFVFLGEISYGIYILQFPVFKFLIAINERYMHISGQYFFYIGLVVLLVVSALSYVLFEKPLRRKINSLNLA